LVRIKLTQIYRKPHHANHHGDEIISHSKNFKNIQNTAFMIYMTLV
jgi:hypothetical protein